MKGAASACFPADTTRRGGAAKTAPTKNAPEKDAPMEDEATLDMMELFFFAYRDFVKDADRLLEEYRFGRAHHRVLHFVHRRPGLAIASLLDILKITKQSLNRVLKPLLEGGFIEARRGANDGRQRLLYPSGRGAALAKELARLQSARFARVLEGLSLEQRTAATQFLLAMIDENDRPAPGLRLAFPPLDLAGAKLRVAPPETSP